MIRSALVRALFASVLATSAILSSGCSGDPNDTMRDDPSGTLSLALRATAGDHEYRFSNFVVFLYPEYTWLSSYGNEQDVLSAQLSTGRHQASLSSWALERDDGTGNFRRVDATLISSSFAEFEILNGSTTTISFQFETDGEIVTIGSGALQVAARVDERAPICTPLGTDCGDGLWCPPSELTGAPLACRYAGSLALGGVCAGPGDCVANSSCIDSGAGPVCTALCTSESFGTTCPDGGTCTPAGADYGVCSPSGG